MDTYLWLFSILVCIPGAILSSILVAEKLKHKEKEK
jgi:hypothetical protein